MCAAENARRGTEAAATVMFHSSRDSREFHKALARIVTTALAAYGDKAAAEKFIVDEIRERIESVYPSTPRVGTEGIKG